jgi:hypothetical protein
VPSTAAINRGGGKKAVQSKTVHAAAHAITQPEDKKEGKISKKNKSNYFRIIVRPKDEFSSFRYQDVGEPGHIQRLTGRRQDGSWDTQAWLISKQDAHVEDDRLITDTKEARELVKQLEADLKYVRENVFEAKSFRNVPQKVGTRAKKHDVRRENIRDAITARMSR